MCFDSDSGKGESGASWVQGALQCDLVVAFRGEGGKLSAMDTYQVLPPRRFLGGMGGKSCVAWFALPPFFFFFFAYRCHGIHCASLMDV
jgi:hypothetical protein